MVEPGLVRAYLDLRARWVEPYREGPFAAEVQRIWARRDAILDPDRCGAADVLPLRPLPSNIFGEDESVAIDWAYCGLGALGLDAGLELELSA